MKAPRAASALLALLVGPLAAIDSTPAFAAPSTPPPTAPSKSSTSWECEADNDGYPQSLSVEFSGDTITSFSYMAMAPAPSGDTFFTCSFSADRSNGESTWKESVGEIEIAMKDPVNEEDRMFLSRMKDTITLRLEMSPSNCGHSTPFASSISIVKGKKSCKKIELSG